LRRTAAPYTYGVEVMDPVDVPLALGITVAVDALAHDIG